MKLGLFTACLPTLSLEEVVSWSAAMGYEELEVAAWPTSPRHLDVDAVIRNGPDPARDVLDEHEVQVCALSYYANNLHPDPVQRGAINEHVRKCIDAAALVGSPAVATFVGRDWTKSVRENLIEAEEVFAPLVDHANNRGVKIVIENCVMEGWHPDGYPGNLAYSPELWEWVFEQGLYLNYDPSHLLALGIDPIEALIQYADHVALAQAKDIQVFPKQRNRYGWPGKSYTREDPSDVGWWRYRLPGLGEVDWRRLVDAMYEAGYDGVLSVEHEDPVWDGSVDKVKVGLEIAYTTLRSLVVG